MRILIISICILLFAACSKEDEKKSAAQKESMKSWYMEAEKDDFRKRKYVYGLVNSINENAGAFAVACEQSTGGEKKIFLSIKTKRFLGESEDYGRILYYILGNAEPRIDWWVYSDHGAYKAPEYRGHYKYDEAIKQIEEFTENLRHADSLRIKAKTFKGEDMDFVFKVDGFDSFYPRIINECEKS